MFETLFTYPRVLRRHREGPLTEERAAYLSELAAQCVAPATLIKQARCCLRVAVELERWPADHCFDNDEVREMASRYAAQCRAASSRNASEHFRATAVDLLRRLGRLRLERTGLPNRYEAMLCEFIAASTRPGEEARVLAAFQQVKAESCRPLLLLVPRHPQRFDKVARLCVAQGLKLQRRSVDAALDSSTEVLLGDSMGELLSYYRLADIAFVGGSLVDTGGQNVLEPAALGLPVVVGPSQFNFATVCQQLAAAGALLTVPDSAGLAAVWRQLLHDPATVQAMGHAGSTLVRENRQALPKLLTLIETGLLR